MGFFVFLAEIIFFGMDLITPNFGLIFWQTVIFLVVVLILRKFVWTSILKIIHDRELMIATSISDAQKAKLLVEDLEKQKRNIINAMEVEKKKIIDEALVAKQNILHDAEEEAKKLIGVTLDKAKVMIELERREMFENIRTEISTLSVYMAEQLIMNQLRGDHEQTKLINNMLQESKNINF